MQAREGMIHADQPKTNFRKRGAGGDGGERCASRAGETRTRGRRSRRRTACRISNTILEAQTHWAGAGGSAKEATAAEFPISQSIAGVSMRLKPGAMRELHWHSLAAEWAYMLAGRCRVTVIHPKGRPRSPISKWATPGISRAGTATPCKDWVPASATFYWDSTTGIFPNSAPSA